jgi:hypothetical protein
VARGSSRDRQEGHRVRPHRPQAQAPDHDVAAGAAARGPDHGFQLDTSTNEKILALFDGSVYIQNTLDKDTTTREEEALIEVFKKQRPGEPPTLDNARNLLKALFFDPKRYDLTGRPLQAEPAARRRVPDDTACSRRGHPRARRADRAADEPRRARGLETTRPMRAQLNRDPIRAELDEVRALRQPASAYDGRAGSRRRSGSASTGWSALCVSG